MRNDLIMISMMASDPAKAFFRVLDQTSLASLQPTKILFEMERRSEIPDPASVRASLGRKFRNSLDVWWRDGGFRYLMVEQRYLKFRESAALHPDLRPLRHLFGHDFNDEFVICDALWTWDGYMTPGFGGGLDGIGWFLALKGELGHRHLASRRILAYGPWRLLRMEDDVTFIEFHDPDADEATALEQAKPGHAMMWKYFIMPDTRLPDDGQPLNDGSAWTYGVYDTATRTLTRMMLPGAGVTNDFLDIFGAVRNFERLDIGPIDHVDLLFMDEVDATEHRFFCWLYGHGCRTFRDGEEVDLLVDYEPPAPEVPDWVRELDAKEGVDTDAVRAELMG